MHTESILIRENLIYTKALLDKYDEEMKINTDFIIRNDMGPVEVVEARPETIGILTFVIAIMLSNKL